MIKKRTKIQKSFDFFWELKEIEEVVPKGTGALASLLSAVPSGTTTAGT
jgi:hypothetical protein